MTTVVQKKSGGRTRTTMVETRGRPRKGETAKTAKARRIREAVNPKKKKK